MGILKQSDVISYVEHNIGIFHEKRIESLHKLKLITILKKKNPYLFKAKNVSTANEIVTGILDAHISSNEETIFGDWLEGLAIFINQRVYDGWESAITGIDLEFDRHNIRYLVSIKSGPNWGNSSQVKRMISDFNTARKTLRTHASKMNIIFVNGCCYGKDPKPDKNGIYFKYCGQEFWEFISGDLNLYTDIIEPLGYKAKEKNDEFYHIYTLIVNRFIREFTNDFCSDNGDIMWKKIIELNSKKHS